MEGKFIVIENNHPTYVIKEEGIGSVYMAHHSSIERVDVIRNNKITEILNS
jgi:hypothetical protein